MSKFTDPEKQAMEDFKKLVASGALGGIPMPVHILFGDPKEVEPASEAVIKHGKRLQERVRHRAKRALAALRRGT